MPQVVKQILQCEGLITFNYMITMAVNVEEFEHVYIVIVALKFYKLGLNHIFPLIVTNIKQLIVKP